MTSSVLALKYRPRSFDLVVGQEHVVKALTHALVSGRLHHAYLFTGTRGVGKTTLSRILAKCLNCVGSDGLGNVTPNPCNVCANCEAIDRDRHVDYLELDAASNRGVAEMAQLLEQAIYAPSIARYKVFMIDEVHMLTSHAFNSMLKTLEEPPAHVKFVLATTDPQKIPVTVLSRCIQFNLRQMAGGQLYEHISRVLQDELVSFEGAAISSIVHAAQGSVRDALSLTDQVLAFGGGAVTERAATAMLGTPASRDLICILDAIKLRDGSRLLEIADTMRDKSVSMEAVLQDLGSLFTQIAIAKISHNAVSEQNVNKAEVIRLAGVFSDGEIHRLYQIVIHGREEMALAPDEYAGFTMTLLRMLAFQLGTGSI